MTQITELKQKIREKGDDMEDRDFDKLMGQDKPKSGRTGSHGGMGGRGGRGARNDPDLQEHVG